MVIKDGELASADEVIEAIGNITTQLAYEQVKADSTNWTNTDYLGADIFTDSDGAKNTVDIGNTSSQYDVDSNFYALSFTDEASGDTNSDPDSFTNASNAFDGNDSTYAEKTTSNNSLGKTFSSKYIGWVRIKAEANTTVSPSDPLTTSIKLQTYNGSTWSDAVTLDSDAGSTTSLTSSFDSSVFLDTTTQGLRILFSGTGGTAYSRKLYTLEYGNFDASSSVETNTIINEVVPDSIVVYGKTDLPTGTSITVDVSDNGGTSFALTGKSLNTAIDTSSFTTGDLALKFNLATTDTSVTPKLYGYGVAIVDK